MKEKKLKLFHIKCVVWEYYEVEAYSKREALKKEFSDPYIVDQRSKQIVKDRLA